MDKCFDMFIYIQTIVGQMNFRDIWVRVFGIILTLAGAALIIISGDIYGPAGIEGVSDSGSEFMLRGGFGMLLIGLLILFLFSWRSVPEGLSWSFLKTDMDNLNRDVRSLNLQGKGIYFPAGGRLASDRVFIPLEQKPLPLPVLNEISVFSVGESGPSMGKSIVPPGRGLVNEVEKQTEKRFRDDRLADSNESMEKIGKGTGLIGDINVRDRKNSIEVSIKHSRLKSICDYTFDEYPDLHEKCGCPGCSAVICALARVAKMPLRVDEVEREDDTVRYTLIKEG